MARYENDYGPRRARPDLGNHGPGHKDDLYGGGYPNRWGVWRGPGGPGGYGRDYGSGGYAGDPWPDRFPEDRRGEVVHYGRDYRHGGHRWDEWPGGYPEHRTPRPGYGREYRTGGRSPRGRGTAYGYRGPGTDLGEDIARGYVSRWREPRYGREGEPGRRRWPGW